MKPKILVVDDEAVIRTVVHTILSRRQMEVHVAQTQAEVEKLIADHKFAVIILDVKIGSISGLDILKSLRDQHKVDSAVLMMSGLADTGRITEASKYGIKGFIMKPFNAKALEDKVQACLAS